MKNKYEQWYMEQLSNIINNGQARGDRTGTGVLSLPNLHYTHDLRESYPIMFSRGFKYKQPITEQIWMMSGSTNIQYLKDNDCPFWNGFATKEENTIQEDLNRVERLMIHANNRGVSVAETLSTMAMVPVEEIDALLDKNEIPNVRDVVIPKGELGPVYGHQWRYWPNPDGSTFDQLQYALNTLRKDPNSRRVVVNCWNPSYLPDPLKSPAQNAVEGKMALTPCHFAFGFYTEEIPQSTRWEMVRKLFSAHEEEKFQSTTRNMLPSFMDNKCGLYNVPTHYLDINFTMRSNDWILGQPANMNMYSAMLMMFAQQLNMIPRYVNYTGWDCHVYTNHLDGARIMMDRWETGKHHDSVAKMELMFRTGLFDYKPDDFMLSGYITKHEDFIKFPIAI